MPRIRKKTSKRGTTNKRARIQHKVAESRKKSKKAAKKNPQWKSKHPKDPGIPNNFPYKDDILAEVAEERRKAAEEKQRKKEEKKAGKNKSGSAEERSDAGGSEDAFDGIASLDAKSLSSSDIKPKNVAVDGDQTQKDVPMLINPDLPNLKSVLDEADVLLEVLDARDPLSFRSSHLEELALAKPGSKILFVLNKIDTCPRESVTLWAKHLRNQYPTFLFRVASSLLPAPEILARGKGKAKSPNDDALGVGSILECLRQWAQEKGKQPLTVAVVGLTNVGKSSFINSLLRKPILPTYKLSTSSRGPTTTTHPHEVTLETSGERIRFIDTPGLSWHMPEKSPEDIDALRARDILLRSKGRIDRLKDPAPAVAQIVLRSDTEDLMLLYNLPAFAKGDADAFLSSLARSHGLVKKHGTLDLTSAARIVLRDWSIGKFPQYTIPQPSSSAVAASVDASLAVIYTKDESILSALKSRKEMRMSGLVKFKSGEVESRKAEIEEPWKSEDRDDVSEEDGENAGEPLSEQEESEAEEEEEESNSEEDEDEDMQAPSPPSPDKQKRKRGAEATLLSNKKVAFAPHPKGSKQARAAASRKVQEKPKAQAVDKIKSAKPKTSAATDKKLRKVANVASKLKLPTATLNGKIGGDDSYDFSKFF